MPGTSSGGGDADVAHFISNYGVWVVAVFIALESVGIPLPAEAALIAAAFFAAKHGLDIWPLICAGILAAIVGEIVGFWIGRRFGYMLLSRYGVRLGMTEGRVRIGQWLFVRYGGRFVFIARFLPFLRNMAAVLAGTNAMAQHNFYFASATAAAAWITCYGFAAYSFGEAFETMASSCATKSICWRKPRVHCRNAHRPRNRPPRPPLRPPRASCWAPLFCAASPPGASLIWRHVRPASARRSRTAAPLEARN